jgi:NAD-dependent SIR2 family protein deacetylase
MCLNCHQTGDSEGILINADVPPVEFSHEWLPERDLHWNKVRCVDCHTSYEGKNLAHNIMPKEKAVKNCESCHSKNSILMTKLYKFEHKESREKMGFINGVLLSEAYVIGSTRNKIMDNASFLIFGLAFFGIAVHGFIRFMSNKKERKEDD